MKLISAAGLTVAVAAALLAVLSLFQWTSAQQAIVSLQTVAEASRAAIQRIGTGTLEPAKQTEIPNVARDPSIVPAPITRTDSMTVEVHTTTREITAELADGTTYDFWTFDGTVPGPLHRVMEGDTVRLTITNPSSSKSSHNIDLHAVNGPGGGAAVTNVAPGESKTFTFNAVNAGAYVYHCAFPPPYLHVSQGMYGAIIVEPRGGLPRVDREFYVMQGEWYTVAAFNAKGHQLFSSAKALGENPEYFTFNGHVDALTKIFPLRARVGETTRLFFGVGGPNVGANFHIIGEIFDKVYPGSGSTFTANEETWYVPPGSVSTMEFRLNEPGQYLLVDHALWRVAKGAAGVLVVDGDWDEGVFSPRAPTPAN